MHTEDIKMNKYGPNVNEQIVICLEKLKTDFSPSDQRMPVNMNYSVLYPKEL